MRVLVLGGEGMLGHKVFQVLAPALRGLGHRSWTPRGPWSDVPDVRRSPERAPARRRRCRGFRHASSARSARCEPDVVINCIGIIKQLEGGERPDPQPARSTRSSRTAWPMLCRGRRRAADPHQHRLRLLRPQGHATPRTTSPTPRTSTAARKFLGEVDRPGCLTIRTSIIGRELPQAERAARVVPEQPRRARCAGYRNAIYTGLHHAGPGAASSATCSSDHPDLSGVVPGRQPSRSASSTCSCKLRDALWRWTSRSSRTTTCPATAA